MAIFADDAPGLASSVIMLTTLAFLSYGLRVYVRVTRKSWAVEDWIMTAALIPFSRLQEPGNEKYQAEGQKFFLIFEVGYCAAIIPIKLSISWMLIRVAEGRKMYIYTQYAIISLFTVMNIIALIFILTDCIPVQAAWDKSLLEHGGRCQPPHVLTDVYYATTAVNIVTDWVTALMPIPLLWNVQLERGSKISVVALMSLGILASLSACVRLKYTINLTNQTDFLFAVANVVIWGFAENGIGVIVGNVATLRPLLRKLLDRTVRRSGYNSRPSRLTSSYELSQNRKGDPGYTSTVTEVRGGHGRSNSQLSDGDSQKMIIEGNAGQQRDDIVVSRQVNVSYG
ncbi:hypothetical protein BDW59DRAFT_157891 [Aspergillus cavernicola]|uniref:Rhodopsin domain-containing protein n=1 Tax=Aspergillus cavernicola TaxID=176166 RepID=A0ABR4IW21_9EURO